MTIKFEKGDLFEVEADVIAHGCNCQGVMGAGIAKAFRAKFPEMYNEYSTLCADGFFVPGDHHTWQEDGTIGVNLMTQEMPGADATTDAVLVSLIGVSQKLTRASFEPKPIVLAMPLIGCGIGGLRFSQFYNTVRMVEFIFRNITYKIVYNDDNENLVADYI